MNFHLQTLSLNPKAGSEASRNDFQASLEEGGEDGVLGSGLRVQFGVF